MRIQAPYKKHAPDELVMEEFILDSEVMHSIMKVAHEVAKYDVNVLITGESGTGKELLAKIIHLQSPRAEHAFVPVNCGVLSGLMFEDKLFGHEKGAFTGAIGRKTGCFEMAHNGTLFLDEVSDIPLANQVDFLRVLEEFRFTRIGGSTYVQVDVRLVSATNKDLKTEVARTAFREDLFYRLQVVPIHIPPLRERREAIDKMVDHFLNLFADTYRKPKPDISKEVVDILCRYDWPGNVRELKNLIERVFIVTHADIIQVDHLPSDFVWHFNESPEVMSLEQVRRDAEIKAIAETLYRSRGDRKKAARRLGISPRTLRHKIQTYDLKIDGKGELSREQS